MVCHSGTGLKKNHIFTIRSISDTPLAGLPDRPDQYSYQSLKNLLLQYSPTNKDQMLSVEYTQRIQAKSMGMTCDLSLYCSSWGVQTVHQSILGAYPKISVMYMLHYTTMHCLLFSTPSSRFK